MASGTKNKGGRASRGSVAATKPKPWGTIIAVVAVLALAVGVFGYAYIKISDSKKFLVTEENKDPSTQISDVVVKQYAGAQHVTPEQRVAYDQNPPFGGPHDAVWANCTGFVYPAAVRNESMVHSLEHGAIWITYNPDQVKDANLDKLKSKVEGVPYMMLSPYPNLDKPISLQAWGHQLKLENNPDDERIDQFIKSLRQNRYLTAESAGGSCDNPTFDTANPPPYVAEKPGPDAVTMDGKGAIEDSAENGQSPPMNPTTAPVPTSGAPASGAPSAAPTGAPPASQ